MNPSPPTKVYLGDAVYADIDPPTGGVILTTENGVEATNTIILEPEVLAALVVFLRRHLGSR